MIARDRLEVIGQKIAVGAVPREVPMVADGTWGTGRACVICDEVIATDQAEVTAHFPHHAPHQFHVRCFVQWWEIAAANDGTGRAR